MYAYRKSKRPSPRRFSFRVGIQHPVLRLGSWSFLDDGGNEWISVLPVPYGVLDTHLNPHNVVRIPADDCVAYKETVPDTVHDVICRIFNGEHPDYLWIKENKDADRRRPDSAYPTVGRVLQHPTRQ